MTDYSKYNLQCDDLLVGMRPWMPSDAPSLALLANDKDIWRNLTESFPHPYTLTDAETWTAYASALPHPVTQLAITKNNVVVGGMGVDRKPDVERFTGVVGAWVGSEHRGSGLAATYFTVFTNYLFEQFDFQRLEARVYAWNPISGKVLQRIGYTVEANCPRSVFRDGQLIDSTLLVRLRPEPR